MKKLGLIVATPLLALTLAACGNTNDNILVLARVMQMLPKRH